MQPKYKPIQAGEMYEHGNLILADAVSIADYTGARPHYDLMNAEPESTIATVETVYRHDACDVLCSVEIIFRKAPYLTHAIRSTFAENALHKSVESGYLLLNSVQIADRKCTWLSEQQVDRIDWNTRSELDILGDADTILHHVKAHLFNFPYFESTDVAFIWIGHQMKHTCRLSFQLAEYTYTISSLPETGTQHERLNENGVHQLTHVLEIQHRDGECFSVESAKAGIRYFEMLLSFVAGKRVPVMLPVGYSSDDVVVWQHITTAKIIREVLPNWSFFNCRHIGIQKQLKEIAERFNEVINTNRLTEFDRILDWYLAAQTADSFSVQVTACVSCLEKIALFDNPGASGKSKVQQLTEIFMKYRIDIELDESFRQLRTPIFENFVELAFAYRSDFAHAKQTYEFPADVVLAITARLMRITDLAMLAMVRYMGDYLDRHNHTVWCEPLLVPWAEEQNA